jgi:hypothetical protein
MVIYLNKETLESELLDTKNVAIISENFTYVINKLIDYVDPTISNKHKEMPEIVGGQRRMTRAMRSKGLGYQYVEAAGKLITKSGGSKIINAFGSNILVEEWTVTHPHVVDSQMGEEYPTANSNGEPRGPYTCKITARSSISKKTPTRCYLQCNCKDFQTSFYEKLNQAGYTNPQSLPASKGVKYQDIAICKHLYAIYSQHYSKLIQEVEGYKIDESPLLFGAQPGTKEGETLDQGGQLAPQPDQAKPVAKNKKEAIDLIRERLQQEHDRLKRDELAYLDSRSKSSGGGRHHLYMFYVVLLNGNLRAIAYRNKNKADNEFKNNSAIQLLVVPDNPKIWSFFKAHADHKILWDLIRSFGEMPEKMKLSIQKKVGIGVHMEDIEIPLTDLTYAIEAPKGSILSSISELT